jgi:hypothetical protein
MRSYGTRNGYSSHRRGQWRKLSSSKSSAQHLKRCLPLPGMELPLKTLLSADSIPGNIENCADVANG